MLLIAGAPASKLDAGIQTLFTHKSGAWGLTLSVLTAPAFERRGITTVGMDSVIYLFEPIVVLVVSPIHEYRPIIQTWAIRSPPFESDMSVG